MSRIPLKNNLHLEGRMNVFRKTVCVYIHRDANIKTKYGEGVEG